MLSIVELLDALNMGKVFKKIYSDPFERNYMYVVGNFWSNFRYVRATRIFYRVNYFDIIDQYATNDKNCNAV